MKDVFVTEGSLRTSELRFYINSHFHNLVSIILRNKNFWFLGPHIFLLVIWIQWLLWHRSLILKALSERNGVEFTSLIVDLWVVMPCLIIILDYLGCFLAIWDCLLIIFSSQLRKWLLVHRSGLELLVLEIKVPFAQLQVAFTQLLAIFDLLIINHFLKHVDCFFLFLVVVICLVNWELDLG